jgi:hypothetical protein
MASSKYFDEVNEATRLKLTFDSAEISLKETGDCDCGVEGGGFFPAISELYDRPVRGSVGVGVGVEACC